MLKSEGLFPWCHSTCHGFNNFIKAKKKKKQRTSPRPAHPPPVECTASVGSRSRSNPLVAAGTATDGQVCRRRRRGPAPLSHRITRGKGDRSLHAEGDRRSWKGQSARGNSRIWRTRHTYSTDSIPDGWRTIWVFYRMLGQNCRPPVSGLSGYRKKPFKFKFPK
jgi:hypothetical protein